MQDTWLSPETLKLIKHFEGCRLKSYIVPGEEKLQATIGWGQAIPLSQHPKTITQKEADDLLLKTVTAKIAAVKLTIVDSVEAKLTPMQKTAIVSFYYNTKPASFKSSTFLRLLNSGDLPGASKQLPRWVRGEGNKILPGLVRRRKCEKFLMDGGSFQDLEKLRFFM